MSRRPSLRVKVCNEVGKITVVENFGFEESFRRRWDSAKKLQEFQKTAKIKYIIHITFFYDKTIYSLLLNKSTQSKREI